MALKRCGDCEKKVPKQYKVAHEDFHTRGNRVGRHQRRSDKAVENLRISKIRRKQK